MIGAGRPLLYLDHRIHLTHDQAQVCWSLMKACPGHLTALAISERLGSEAEAADNLIKVHVCRIRRILRDLGLPQPIVTLHGHRSYAWDPKVI
jgi:DNA-binding response OmpR family regulator